MSGSSHSTDCARLRRCPRRRQAVQHLFLELGQKPSSASAFSSLRCTGAANLPVPAGAHVKARVPLSATVGTSGAQPLQPQGGNGGPCLQLTSGVDAPVSTATLPAHPHQAVAGELPLNSTCIMRIPVTLLSISPPKCTDDPVPNGPYELVGCRFGLPTQFFEGAPTSLFTSSTSPICHQAQR